MQNLYESECKDEYRERCRSFASDARKIHIELELLKTFNKLLRLFWDTLCNKVLPL